MVLRFSPENTASLKLAKKARSSFRRLFQGPEGEMMDYPASSLNKGRLLEDHLPYPSADDGKPETFVTHHLLQGIEAASSQLWSVSWRIRGLTVAY
jgi:hypothetical protein